MNEFAKKSAEADRTSKKDLFYVENSLKAYKGRHAALADQKFFASRVAAEKDFRAKIEKDPKLKKEYAGAWDGIAAAMDKLRMYRREYELERGPQADRWIAALGMSQLQAVGDVVEDGIRSGAFRAVDARALVYSFSAIPAFFFLMAPVIERILGEEAVSQEAVEAFADGVADLVLHGLLAPGAGREE